MDTNWMSSPRNSSAYKKGLDKFIDYIFKKEGVNGEIACPCNKCVNLKWVGWYDARTHLLCDGFFKGCTIKTSISEPCDIPMEDAEDDMIGFVSDTHHWFDDNILETEDHSLPNKSAKKFYKGLESAKQELYPGCKKFFILSFVVRLFHSKCISKCNDKGFSMIIDTLREAFPEVAIPKSLYDLWKLIRDLGLGYEKIDAYPNNCMLYWKENKDKTECVICHSSRYKTSEVDSDNEENLTTNDHNKVPAKVLRYFPVIPRLQRLYMSSEVATSMRWHEEGRTKDGLLRHPVDSPAWQTFDHNYPEFAKESRNVRLGLASDGFNPFGNMSNSHSTWLVVLIPYSLPPWMCMKKPYFMLTLLIPGPSVPGNNIDIYLEPLVDELKLLWDHRVETYESSTNNNFQMRADMIWTISDFPAYANLSGWSTKVKDNPVLPYNWKKRSIFFKLPYWKDNLIRHNLDVMHIEKNVCDSVIGTLMNLDGKTKDHLNGRYDLEEMGIRKELHPEVLENNKVYLPPTCFSMNKKEKDRFCRMLRAGKVPDGYSAKISRCVQLNPPKIGGLKSHDNHILMQQLLPICIRNSLPKHAYEIPSVLSVVMKLCRYYRRLCCKVLDPTELVQMENDIGKIFCDMEGIFSPSFFDIMVHLSVHLAYEARIGGSVHYRWMYPIEREHLSILWRENKKERQHLIQRMHSNKFEKWFGKHVRKLHKQGVDGISEDLRHLANGPSEYTEKKRKMQNSGVMLEATTNSFSSVRDKNPIVGVVTYYGVLKEIIELQYGADKKVVLFRCDWISNGSSQKEDKNGFTMLNFCRLKEDKEPFILASQAQQVFYVKDCVHKGWKVVIKTKPRDSYEMNALTYLDDVETHLQSETGIGPQIDENMNIELVREDIDGIVVDNITTTYTDTNEDHLEDDAIID
ncbi:uncharacterized protein [Rutidosis leptorrhynchoides]|uniref:uncharacterized protein n=1 Tax=Rutidosis leptorrhynchoides TaxID=125765 RepID=UPI003A994F9D